MSLFVKPVVADQRRAPQVTSSPPHHPPVPAGPEAAPSTVSTFSLLSGSATPSTVSRSAGLSSAEIVYIATSLSLLGLIALGLSIWKVIGLRKKKKGNATASGEGGGIEKDDPEAPSRQFIPVAPPPGVGWTPQIRSISCPQAPPKKRAPRPIKRPRSPSPASLPTASNPFADPAPKSAPSYSGTFFEKDLPKPLDRSNLYPFASTPVTPCVLSVSTLEAKAIARHLQLGGKDS